MSHRRWVAFWLLVSLLAASCGSGSSSDQPEGTAAEIVSKVFAAAGVEPFGEAVPLTTPEEIEFFLGSTDYPPFTDTAVVQPPISIDARILYVLEVATEEEAAQVIEQLSVDIDPNRLICVTFTPDDVSIESRGSVVFMTINSDHDQKNALTEAFTTID